MSTPAASVAGEHANGMVPRLFEIRDLTWETGDGSVFTWRLAARDSEPFSFKPGQFNMLYAFGTGEIPISTSGDCSDRTKLVHTVREVGMVSAAITRLQAGDTLGVRGGGLHTTGEWIELASLVERAQLMACLLARLSDAHQ